MAPWLIRDAPILLAVLDENLLCLHFSRGWRARLGLLNTEREQGLSISERFLLDEKVSLEPILRESPGEDEALQDIPVSLRGENGITRG